MLNRVLVTGGAGFIASHVVDYLLSRAGRVRVLDDLSTGRLDNLEHVRDDIELVHGSTSDPSAALAACQGVDVVFHLAAIPSVPRSIEDPLRTNHANVTGTLALLLAARDAGVQRLVYSSSSSVYGNQVAAVKTEDLCPGPLSPYAISKHAAEQYCQIAPAIFQVETVSLRYFNVFGPRQQPGSAYGAVIPRFINRMLSGESPVIEGTGEQSRDFTYVENVVQANWLAGTVEGVSGEVFNVACGHSWTLLDIVAELNRILDSEISPEFVAPRRGDVFSSLAGIEKAAQMLGFVPRVSVPEGLERTVSWARQDQETP